MIICDFAILPVSNCWKTYISSNVSCSFFQFLVLQVPFPSVSLLVNPFNFLQFYSFLFFTLESSNFLYVSAEFSIFFFFALKTVCLMLPKLLHTIFLIQIGVLHAVHLPDNFEISHSTANEM